MSKKVLYEGPDLSANNGIVNIKQIRDSGYGHIGLRAGYGKNNVDQRYASNAQACFNLKIPVLLYWFSYAYTVEMAAAEAGYAVAQAAKYWERCPIAYDFEYESLNYARKKGVTVTKALCTDMAIAFLRGVRAAGYTPILYAGRDYLNRYFDRNRIRGELGTVYLWYARYNYALSMGEMEEASIWQYTSDGRIPGVPKQVDLNRFFMDIGPLVLADRSPVPNINILNFQKAANADGYRDAEGRKLAEDGLDGPRTRYVCRQIHLKARRVGPLWRVGSIGEVVRWHQIRCNEILGTDEEEDGQFGKRTRSETIQLQKKLGLKADGVAGYNTLQAEFYH
ncbi:MAG: hypothetical protein HFI29_05200 [Lachnospiraceae bacterium]|jgi:lysozyme|nr:hypothetical protein [Lachnospiraceae bacterium]